MRARTSASQACGSMSLSLAVAIRRVHGGGALAAAIGAGEEPCLSAEGDAAQRAFGGVVGQADPAVVEEAGEGGPALEHVVHGLGDRRRGARGAARSRAHPGFELGDQRARRRSGATARRASALGAVDRALDVEDRVDALDRLERERRDRRRLGPRARSRRCRRARRTCAGACAQHSASVTGPRRAVGSVERAEAGIGVGLQDAGTSRRDGAAGCSPRAVAGVVEQRRGRGGAAEGPVVADIGPEPAGDRSCPWPAPARSCRRRAAARRRAHAPRSARGAARARRRRRRPGRPASRG